MTAQLACMTQMLIRSAGARHSGTATELCQSSAARMAKATVPRSGGGGGEGRSRRG